MLSGMYTGGIYPTYPSTYGGFYGYPYFGGEAPYPSYGGYYPYSANFQNNYNFFGAGGYYPTQTYGAFYPFFGDAYYNQPTLDYGYRGRPAYTGYQYGGLPFYGGQSGAPLNPYAPYPLAGGNQGARRRWPEGRRLRRRLRPILRRCTCRRSTPAANRSRTCTAS